MFNPVRVVTNWYGLLIVIILATYEGNMVSFLSVQKPILPINSLEELARNPEYSAEAYKYTSFHDMFEVSEEIR